MPIAFKPEETFRDDFAFRNSPEAIRRFPFPFAEDVYMYSVNIERRRSRPDLDNISVREVPRFP